MDSREWKNLHNSIFEINGRKSKRFVIAVTGKTGSRLVIPNQGTEKILNDLKEFRKSETNDINENEFVFAHKNGEQIKSFKKGLQAFLEHYQLLENKLRETRTLYSLRHFYCENAIRLGVSHWHIAENAGISVDMLKSYCIRKNFNDVVNSFADTSTHQGQKGLF